MKLKLVLLSVPALIMIIFFVSFFSARGTVDKNINQLVMGSIGDASYLNPVLSQDSASSDINSFVFNGLLKYDKDLNIKGDLALSWKVIERNKPVIVFILRKGVMWHDGVEFTSKDVKFTFEKIMDKKTNTVRRSDYELVEGIKLVDDYKLEVRYSEPFSPGLESWMIGILPEHILAGADINTTEFNRNPVGTGPFRFREWKSDEKIVLEANEDYFEGRPFLDRIIYRIIPETSLSEVELLTGGIDYSSVYPRQYERIKRNNNFEVYTYPSRGYSYIGYNLQNPIFNDKRVRQALTFALDRKKIVDHVLYGHGVLATGPFPGYMWYCNTEIPPYPYSVERARELLASAGWVDSDGDGVLDKEGKRFEFELITNSGNDIRRDVAVLAQRQWKEIGVVAIPRFYEWATFLDRYVNPRNFDACVLGWSLGVDPDQYSIWHSSQIKDGFNSISYRNEEVDNLLVAGRREYEKGKRKEIYHRIHEILAEEQPYTFLFVGEALPVLNKKFVVVEYGGGGKQTFHPVKIEKAGLLYDLIKWYVPGRPVMAK